MVEKKVVKIEKQFWKSKTFWWSVLLIVGGVTTALAESLSAGIPLTFVGVVNLVLRVYTDSSIKWEL